jgi:CubicO group peptidase (beta-lactamase class C family)
MPRPHSRLFWIAVFLGIPLLMLAGMWTFVLAWKPPMHANPDLIESVRRDEPSGSWSAAVARARRVVRSEMSAQNLAGVSVAVGARGEVVWAEGFGWANVRRRAPVTPETRFRIGTASAALTAAAAGVLAQRGDLALDSEIQRYVPQFSQKQQPITVRQLFKDPGQPESYDGDGWPLAYHRCEKPADALQYFPADALPVRSGERPRDARYGWVLVSAAVEAASRQPFGTAMRELVFRPLRMERTGAESPKEENPERVGEEEEDAPPFRLVRDLILEPLGMRGANVTPEIADPATIYARGLGPNTVFRYGMHEVRVRNLSCFAGAMAFISTASDLVRFGMDVSGGGLLKPDTIEPGGGGHAADVYGMLAGRRVVALRVFRAGELVVAVMSNSGEADPAGLAQQVAEAFGQGK